MIDRLSPYTSGISSISSCIKSELLCTLLEQIRKEIDKIIPDAVVLLSFTGLDAAINFLLLWCGFFTVALTITADFGTVNR